MHQLIFSLCYIYNNFLDKSTIYKEYIICLIECMKCCLKFKYFLFFLLIYQVGKMISKYILNQNMTELKIAETNIATNQLRKPS